jgi:hypothetical protein
MGTYAGASADVPRRSSEFGSRRSGWGPQGQLCQEDIPITDSAVDVVISVGATQAAGITLQFNHSDGSPIAHIIDFDLYVVKTDGTDVATTGGSTGIAIGANGKIVATVVTKKVFKCFSDVNGLFKATWTDNATEAAALAVRLPTGRRVVSAALPTA